MDQRRDLAPQNEKRAFPVDIIVNTGAGKVSYMSLAFYHMTARLGRSVTPLTKQGRGAPHATKRF